MDEQPELPQWQPFHETISAKLLKLKARGYCGDMAQKVYDYLDLIELTVMSTGFDQLIEAMDKMEFEEGSPWLFKKSQLVKVSLLAQKEKTELLAIEKRQATDDREY